MVYTIYYKYRRVGIRSFLCGLSSVQGGGFSTLKKKKKKREKHFVKNELPGFLCIPFSAHAAVVVHGGEVQNPAVEQYVYVATY